MEFIIMIIGAIFWGILAEAIGNSKGISGFSWGFFLGPIGLIIVACMSSNNSAKRSTIVVPSRENVNRNKYEQLEKLARLKESGAITEFEFLKEKERIMSHEQVNIRPTNQLSANMKRCKNCGKILDKSLKKCPYCKHDDSANVLIIIFVVLLVIVIIGVANSGSSNSSYKSSSNTNKPSTSSQSTVYTPQERFTLLESKAYFDGFAYYVEGRIKNNTSRDYSYAQVMFTLYDSRGNQLGSAIDNINNLHAYGTWKFKAIGLVAYDESVASYQLEEITGF